MRPYPDVPIWMRPTDFELQPRGGASDGEGKGCRWSKGKEDKLIALHDEGLTWRMIGDIIGLDGETVRQKYYRLLNERVSDKSL